MSRWFIQSGKMTAMVVAEDQWAAWDEWRDKDEYDFGLLVTAEADEDGNVIPVKTSQLMERWGRTREAEQFHALARSHGLET